VWGGAAPEPIGGRYDEAGFDGVVVDVVDGAVEVLLVTDVAVEEFGMPDGVVGRVYWNANLLIGRFAVGDATANREIRVP
jgi:hypothetical protein